MEVQRESHFAQAKTYFKNVIDREIKKFPEIEFDKLGNLITYEKEINEQDDWESLSFCIKKLVKEIKKIRSNKIASIEELKEKAKKNISETLTKSKLRTEDLHPRHQN